MPSSNPKPINMAIGATTVKQDNPIKTWRVVKFALVKADPRAKLMVELLIMREIAFWKPDSISTSLPKPTPSTNTWKERATATRMAAGFEF